MCGAGRTLFDDPACRSDRERSEAEGRVVVPGQGERRQRRGTDRRVPAGFELVEEEPGTLLYVLHRSRDDPDLFWVCELYADDNAFAAHRTSDAMAAATSALAEFIADAEFITGEPVSAKGVPA
jgi:autoinducer 2-degrading protein